MRLLRSLAVLVGRQPWLPRHASRVVAVDRWLQRLTRGRLTVAGLAGLPELTLTVPGRRSGLLRSTPLLYVSYRGDYLVAGSNWGGPQLPVWVLNLRAHPAARVSIRGRDVEVSAAEVSGADRTELWQVMLETWPNYAKYAERTDREIPVFRLSPRR